MGILNITSDSFYEKSRVNNSDSILALASKMIDEGADIIDIGGQSSRPGSKPVEENEEMDKVLTTIHLILKHHPHCTISVDTYRSNIAKAAVEAGACIINDISAGNLGQNMINTVGKLHVPYICMHMKGTPETMNNEAVYGDVTKEVIEYFVEKINTCRTAGIKDIIIDPGFGFSKNAAQNFRLLKELDLLQIFELPILVGLSRKSTIYKTLGITSEEALNGTTALNMLALSKGAKILRVHDVREAKEAAKLYTSYEKA
ncbi:MAG: dihydropteroate synthase [Ginsengibacter sp.]